jgi:acyl-[acyl-carrier-protein]-phospholipid O-acyltransferase/long-chain-fatty-acid--[acyl-carrier-protein] ligase
LVVYIAYVGNIRQIHNSSGTINTNIIPWIREAFMNKNQFALLTTPRFLPLFMTQFLGAFNDNLFKNALVVLITFMIANQLSVNPAILVVLTGCLLIIPMILFSATAGTFADKFEKTTLIRIIKLVEIALMIIGAFGFIYQNVILLMTVLFGMGLHSTFFGPIKYSILPQHLTKDELLGGNGLIEMGTFLSILLGNILGVVFIMQPNGLKIIAGATITTAILGYISSRFIPKAPPPAPELPLTFNFLKESWQVIKFSQKTSIIFTYILGISWFWLIGFVFLTQFPNYAKEFLGADETVYVLFLAVFSIGVGLGSLLCNTILKGQIKATLIPYGVIGMTVFTVDLYFASQLALMTPHVMMIINAKQFLQSWNHWRITLDLLMIAISAGIYIVPLYTLLQHRAQLAHRARIIASNNIMNALYMVVGALITMALISYAFTIPQIFLIFALGNVVVIVQTFRLLHAKKQTLLCGN